MKAVKRFKDSISHRRPAGLENILGKDTRIVQPPLSMSKPEKPPLYHKNRSVDTHDRRPLEQALVAEGVHRDVDLDNYQKNFLERTDTAVTYASEKPIKRASTQESDDKSPSSPSSTKRDIRADPQAHRPMHAATAPMPIDHYGKGQAHDPLSDHLYLGLGPGGDSKPPSPAAVSESPPAADINIYETAYSNEVQRIRVNQGRSATLFLTRRVEELGDFLKDEGLIRDARGEASKSISGLARVLDQARAKAVTGAVGMFPTKDKQDGGANAEEEEKK